MYLISDFLFINEISEGFVFNLERKLKFPAKKQHFIILGVEKEYYYVYRFVHSRVVVFLCI